VVAHRSCRDDRLTCPSPSHGLAYAKRPRRRRSTTNGRPAFASDSCSATHAITRSATRSDIDSYPEAPPRTRYAFTARCFSCSDAN